MPDGPRTPELYHMDVLDADTIHSLSKSPLGEAGLARERKLANVDKCFDAVWSRRPTKSAIRNPSYPTV